MADKTEIRGRSFFVTIWIKSIKNMELGDLLNDDNEPLDGTGKEIVEQIRELWACSGKGRTSGGVACKSINDGFHIHMGVFTSSTARLINVAKTLGNAHVDPQRGTKEQLILYLKKEGKFEEKGETVLYQSSMDGIGSSQGNRSDLSQIEEYIEKGLTPRQIFEISFSSRKYEKMVKDAYFDKRSRETPFLRDINVIWHVGKAGSGKSYTANKLAETIGEDGFYFVSNYKNGFDKYNGEPILFMDEFRGQLTYSALLSFLHGYKGQGEARYTNIIGLWTEVHITSVIPPEKAYKNMVKDNVEYDTLQQLLRRINTIIYHWKTKDGEYKEYKIPMEEYKSYEELEKKALADKDGFVNVEPEQNEYIWQ